MWIKKNLNDENLIIFEVVKILVFTLKIENLSNFQFFWFN